jgi:hypothetical protein
MIKTILDIPLSQVDLVTALWIAPFFICIPAVFSAFMNAGK